MAFLNQKFRDCARCVNELCRSISMFEKICLTKRSIARKTRKTADLYLHKIWHDDADCRTCLSSGQAVKIILKIQDGGRPIRTRDPCYRLSIDIGRARPSCGCTSTDRTDGQTPDRYTELLAANYTASVNNSRTHSY